MLTVVGYELIRKKHYVDGQSARAIAKKLGHSRKAVAKALAHAVPPGYRQRKPQAKPAIDGYRAIIDGWLDADVARPPKQRQTTG